MWDVVSIGGATQDVFVRSEGAQVIRMSDIRQERAWLGFDYGAKIPVDTIRFTVGGGGTNTAVSFAKLGLNTASLVKVGQDAAGAEIIQTLQAAGVETRLICQATTGQTGYSVVLTSYEGERSILAFRGLNQELQAEDLDWQSLQTVRCFYLSSLSGQSDALLTPLLAFAAQHGIQVAWNPGDTQLRQGLEALAAYLSGTDLLFLNKEEASQLTGLPLHRPTAEHLRPETPPHAVRPGFMYDLDAHLRALKAQTRGLVILTDGAHGTQVYDGQRVYLLPVYPVQVADVLGAGDAFGSAFTAAWLQQQGLEAALCWGAANAAGVVTDPGAHNGLKSPAEIEALCAQYPQVQVRSYALAL